MKKTITLIKFKTSGKYYMEEFLEVPDNFYKRAEELNKSKNINLRACADLQYEFRNYLRDTKDKHFVTVCIPIEGTIEEILVGHPLMLLPN